MDVANPKVISELLTCTKKKLPEIAEQNGMKPSIAAVVREHWIRRLTGVCVRCGHYVKDGACPKCQTKALPGLTLLEQLDPKTNVIQGHCPKCRKTMTFRAGFVLQVIRRTGAFRPQALCRQCQQQKKMQIQARKAEIKARQSAKPVSKKPIRPNPNRSRFRPLTHRPFSALAGLKIEKMG